MSLNKSCYEQNADAEIFSEAKLMEKETGHNISFLLDFFSGKNV